MQPVIRFGVGLEKPAPWWNGDRQVYAWGFTEITVGLATVYFESYLNLKDKFYPLSCDVGGTVSFPGGWASLAHKCSLNCCLVCSGTR